MFELRKLVLPVLIAAIAMMGVLADARTARVEAAPTSKVISSIRERGFLLCGVRDGVQGFSQVDSEGVWSGLDVDFCAALATAVLGSKTAVKFRPLANSQRFGALISEDVDVVAGGAVWTLSRDTELGARFVGTLFHDGQVFLVRREQAVSSVLELSGATICMLKGTHAKAGVDAFFGSREMPYTGIVKERWEDVVGAYRAGDCTVLTGDLSLLAAERLKLVEPGGHQILKEVVSKAPLGPVIKAGDDQWFSVVRWTLMALLVAEERGVTSRNVEDLKTSEVSAIRQLLGADGDPGVTMGLARDWAYQVILQVGNYGECFARNLGAKSPLGLARGLNGLWNQGGLMYGVPLR